MSRLARTAEYSTQIAMSSKLYILQLNMGNQSMVQQSLLDDEDTKDIGVLAVSEPYVWKMNDTLVTVPAGHVNWTKIYPTIQKDERWPIRSMLWIRNDIEAEQIAIQSSDLIAAVLHLPERKILIILIYISGQELEVLTRSIQLLDQAIQQTRT